MSSYALAGILAGVFVIGPFVVVGGIGYAIYRGIKRAKENGTLKIKVNGEPVNEPVPVVTPDEVKTPTAFERNREQTAAAAMEVIEAVKPALKASAFVPVAQITGQDIQMQRFKEAEERAKQERQQSYAALTATAK